MITIKRTSKIEEKRAIVKEIISSKQKNYKVMIDLRNGNVVLIERTIAKYYIQIGKIKLKNIINTSKNINKLASDLNSLIQKYNGKSLICKSRVKSEYGKKGLLDIAFIMAVDNPYYKCAGDMQLYDRNVIEYNLKRA